MAPKPLRKSPSSWKNLCGPTGSGSPFPFGYHQLFFPSWPFSWPFQEDSHIMAFAQTLHFILSILPSGSSRLALLVPLLLAQVSCSLCKLSCQLYLKSQLPAPALLISWLSFTFLHCLIHCITYFVYGLCLLTRVLKGNPKEGRDSLFYSLPYLQYLEQCLAHRRSSELPAFVELHSWIESLGESQGWRWKFVNCLHGEDWLIGDGEWLGIKEIP